MPECKRCDRLQPSGELRRSPAGGYTCKDVTDCNRTRVLNVGPADLPDLLGRAGDRLDAARLHAADAEILRSLAQVRAANDALAEAAIQIAQWGARVGLTQKALANALGVPASTLGGLKRSVAA